MPTGVIVSPDRSSANVIDNVVSTTRAAHEAGVRQVWLPQNFNYDAVALAALVGLAVPGLGDGTSVVPINPRHPLIIASAASHGNFSLGLGLGAPSIEQKAFGISAANTVQRLREHLLVLRSIQQNGTVDFHGEELTAVDPGVMPVSLALAGGTPFPVYVAAMGPRALQVTGELADGTLPNLAGPRTIEQFIVPTIGQAAADAGRPSPKIIAMVQVAVTDDADTVRRGRRPLGPLRDRAVLPEGAGPRGRREGRRPGGHRRRTSSDSAVENVPRRWCDGRAPCPAAGRTRRPSKGVGPRDSLVATRCRLLGSRQHRDTRLDSQPARGRA